MDMWGGVGGMAGNIPPPQPPADPDMRKLIERTAQYVARNGPGFETLTKEKNASNPRFGFLFPGHPFYPFYMFLCRIGAPAPTPPPQTPHGTGQTTPSFYPGRVPPPVPGTLPPHMPPSLPGQLPPHQHHPGVVPPRMGPPGVVPPPIPAEKVNMPTTMMPGYGPHPHYPGPPMPPVLHGMPPSAQFPPGTTPSLPLPHAPALASAGVMTASPVQGPVTKPSREAELEELPVGVLVDYTKSLPKGTHTPYAAVDVDALLKHWQELRKQSVKDLPEHMPELIKELYQQL